MGRRLVEESKKSSIASGVELFNILGGVFIFCGIASFVLLVIVSFMPQNYEKYNIPLVFGIWAAINTGLIILGVIPLFLGKHSHTYRTWINKEYRSYEKHLLETAEKDLAKETKKQK